MYLKNIIVAILGAISTTALMGVDKNTALGLVFVFFGALMACTIVHLAENVGVWRWMRRGCSPSRPRER